MPKTMTMSGQQTLSSVPLDLRTTTRERGGSAERTPDGKGRQRDTVPLKEESPAFHNDCSNGLRTFTPESLRNTDVSSANTHLTKTANGDNETSHPVMAPNRESDSRFSPKCERSSEDNSDLRSCVRNLPIRKRPIPQVSTDSPSTTSTTKKPKITQNLEADCHSSPSCASRTDVHPDEESAVPRVLSQSHDDLQRMPFPHYYPAYPPYVTWSHAYTGVPGIVSLPVCPNDPRRLHPAEDTDHLRGEVALATRQDDDGDTALHIAVVQEEEAMVHKLIHILVHSQRDLDVFNNLRQTPLHLAVITGQEGLVEALLMAGADPCALDRHGQTAAHLCCEHGHAGCLSLVLSLSRHNPSPCLETRNYEGLTPLHLAVQNGDKKSVTILLDHGADINAVDIKSGRSPLIHAVENNNMEMINFLIENGCDVNSQSYSGNTALHSACGRGHVDAVRVLLKNGSDSSLKNYHNDTAVMVAKNKKVTDVLRGKGSRSQSLKTQDIQNETHSPQRSTPHSRQTSINGSPSPNSLGRSPLATPTPVALPLQLGTSRSPPSQSRETVSSHHSPANNQEVLQMRPGFHNMVEENREGQRLPIPQLHFIPSGYDIAMPSIPHIHMGALVQGHPYYTPSVQVQGPVYHPEAGFILLPTTLPVPPVPHCPPTQITANKSRPSSRSSDQSEMSTMSASSEGKDVS
ncbi:B-cell lymphoma 3 protein homolog [Chanos chanos]|uniref:B-cell lymphoma 3 protein homolog n=1 Tax=Chanos chanos TaxID=29144 RepID=A0A6J2W1R3_CHACN|nr:B-cell lymphoma 3 protein [Chanos chanos]